MYNSNWNIHNRNELFLYSQLKSVIKILFLAGGKIDVVQASGMTALLYAVQRSHIKIVEYLLDKGADIEHKNSEGHGVSI